MFINLLSNLLLKCKPMDIGILSVSFSACTVPLLTGLISYIGGLTPIHIVKWGAWMTTYMDNRVKTSATKQNINEAMKLPQS